MNTKTINGLIDNGFAVVKNCIDKKTIDVIKKNINENLINILKKFKRSYTKNLSKNYYETKNFLSQHEIQVILAKKLVDSNLISKMLLSKKVFQELVGILGSDIEYQTDMELAINDKKSINDDYLVKKFHQEFWSGVGVESLLIWIPIHLLSGMGTMELIEKSHTWGHIPHRNREPITIPKDHKKRSVDIKEGSMLIMTALTLHQTSKNTHQQPRIAIPIVVRNFYYPNTNNTDLLNFKKLNFSFFSKFRKILGNKQYSPFRTLGQKRKSIFKKYNQQR